MSTFSALFLRSTLGRLKEKNDWQDFNNIDIACPEQLLFVTFPRSLT